MPLIRRTSVDDHEPISSPAGAEEEIDTDLLSAQLLAVLTDCVGVPVGYAEPPTALDFTYGPRAFSFRLSGPSLPESWAGPLLVRVGGAQLSDEALATETAVLRYCGPHGYRVPELRAVETVGDGSDRHTVLITTRPVGKSIIELIGEAPDRTEELFRRMADNHVALHSMPVTAAELDIQPIVGIDQLGTAKDDDARAWLRANTPVEYSPVLCHGALHPAVLSEEPDGLLTVRNWTDAVLADPEYDVGMTLLIIWSAPYYIATRRERAGLKLVRDMLANMYRDAYQAQRPLDRDRVRYWHAYHTLSGLTRADTPADLVPALRKHFRHLVSG
jgi:hypothetical protein